MQGVVRAHKLKTYDVFGDTRQECRPMEHSDRWHACSWDVMILFEKMQLLGNLQMKLLTSQSCRLSFRL